MSNPECPVCLDPLGYDTVQAALPCGHVFHNDCILSWVTTNRTCPHCRVVQTPANVIKLHGGSVEPNRNGAPKPTDYIAQISMLNEVIDNQATRMAEVEREAEEYRKKLEQQERPQGRRRSSSSDKSKEVEEALKKLALVQKEKEELNLKYLGAVAEIRSLKDQLAQISGGNGGGQVATQQSTSGLGRMCAGKTVNGNPCRRHLARGNPGIYCRDHAAQAAAVGQP